MRGFQVMGRRAAGEGRRGGYLLSLVLFLLLQDVREVDELLHGLHLPIQVLEVHPAAPAEGLQHQPKAL